MYDRIRIVHADGHVSLRDYAFSQSVELLKDLSPAERDAFWKKAETKLPNGDSAYLVTEGV